MLVEFPTEHPVNQQHPSTFLTSSKATFDWLRKSWLSSFVGKKQSGNSLPFGLWLRTSSLTRWVGGSYALPFGHAPLAALFPYLSLHCFIKNLMTTLCWDHHFRYLSHTSSVGRTDLGWFCPRLSGPKDGTVGGPSVAARRVKNSMLQAQSHVLKLGHYVEYIMGKKYMLVYI